MNELAEKIVNYMIKYDYYNFFDNNQGVNNAINEVKNLLINDKITLIEYLKDNLDTTAAEKNEINLLIKGINNIKRGGKDD